MHVQLRLQEGLLDGHLAFITGAASGIGAAIAVAFAKQGAKLIITAEPERQEELDKARLLPMYAVPVARPFSCCCMLGWVRLAWIRAAEHT